MNAPVTGRVLRSGRDRVSFRVDGRSVGVGAVLATALAAVVLTSLTTGEFPLSVGDALRALVGAGEPGHEFIVTTVRLPRVLTAVFVGAALAVGGAILQSLTGNPLGSPDIIGITFGSASGALIVIVLVNETMLQISLGALAGGLGTAVLIYLLAYVSGVQGFRFVLVGIGVGAMALALNSYLITRASLPDALAAQGWLIGSVNGRGWTHATPVGIALAVLVPLALYHGRRLAMLELGDDAARALGIGVERSRLVLIVVSVALAAVATAAAGPIAFVALAAPQLARRLTRAPGPGLVPAALLGGLLLAASDLLVQRLFPTGQLPVGTATGTIGGLYLMWLLATEWRKGRP
ncbi:iron complex transport system permease protein [Amycolatopsis arida]|uniref:Iron complex transport system permease protein n=1 Tax=Amycolatopsis arida TaxID=587909 RepID=A0A1I5ZRN6_9PSEU|nr:iron chelate uptake ABC transporter family permease subunit [Amycolatopsis arida]TDX89315.1 iron complex transport system permease protein [Amycolatopsis arida]SFQ59070.1 iron complex transport system permease protein [Amycolatopsis arida]